MIKHKIISTAISILVCVILISPKVSDGFNDRAHDALSRRSVNPAVTNSSILHNLLQINLGFEFFEGINEPISGGKRVVDLIADGAVKEDYAPRVLNHFHDPTRTWNVAGFKGVGLSSIVWSQLAVQGAGANRSWKNARDAYFNALTNTTESGRKAWYAETFRALGHVIHLVQDAAAPSHTRNDSHFVDPFFGLKIDADPFHDWADSFAGLSKINQSQSLQFDPSILNQASANPLAPVPIARIIDKTDGDLGILSPNFNIGLAEYSNANFISKGTARSTFYQYPTYLQLEFPIDMSPAGAQRRYARFRQGFGEQDYWVGVSSRMARFANATVPPDAIDFGLDNKVHDDYGRKLFPRAIGYSAGLIDYFFRGYITSTAVQSPVVPYANRTNIIRVENLRLGVDVGSEQGGQGTMVLVLTYSHQSGTTESFPPVLVSNPVSINVSSQITSLDFTFGSLPYPATFNPGDFGRASYIGKLVYRGPLGQEPDAIVVGGYCLGGATVYHFFHYFDSVVMGQEVAWLGGSEECTPCNFEPTLCSWLMARRPSANW